MRPYQFGVGGTWIDLDRVLAVRGEPYGDSGRTDVRLTLAYRDKPLMFDLVPLDDYDRFLQVWMSTDVVRGADLLPLLPGPYYMDPPDGGDVPVLEQLRRMAQDAAKWRARSEPAQPASAVWMSDAHIDRVLSTPIPGGSSARDWFLPHETPKGLANVREVVRSMLAAADRIGASA